VSNYTFGYKKVSAGQSIPVGGPLSEGYSNLALFNVAIDSKLPGGDLVKLEIAF